MVNGADPYSAVEIKKSFFPSSVLYIPVLFAEYLSGSLSQVLVHVAHSRTHCHDTLWLQSVVILHVFC